MILSQCLEKDIERVWRQLKLDIPQNPADGQHLQCQRLNFVRFAQAPS